MLEFEFLDDLDDPNVFRAITNYLLNLRRLVALLTNLFLNQVSTLINQVTYDKELFNYGHYRARAMATERDLTSLLFIQSAKHMVQLHYKHRCEQEQLLPDTRKLHSLLAHMGLHLETLRSINQRYVKIEPLLLVFWSEFYLQVIPKEAMSAVSRQFWQEIK